MRARWLKPEFFADKKVAQLGPVAALVYQALWCMADDGGTAPCDADTVKAQMFYRWSAVGVPEITEALRHLSDAGRIVVYAVGDDSYARIPTWKKHQQVHKPSKFRHPAMPKGDTPITPGDSGTSAALLPASPPPRHLDSQTPRHPSTPRARPPRDSWVTEGVALWTRLVGTVAHVEFGAALKPMILLHGWPAVQPDLEKWIAARVAQGKPCNPSWYAKEASARLAPKPALVNEHGELTEYGERMSRPDKGAA